MKIRVLLFIALTTLLVISCRKNEPETKHQNDSHTLLPNPEEAQQDVICALDSFLDNPKIPQLAKDLYSNTAKNNDAALDYFKELEKGDPETRAFYFRVVTNLEKVSDGATSEGLGAYGKSFVETHTQEFIAFFDKKECFNDADLETWADIVMLEISLVYSNMPDASDKDSFTNTLKENCGDCTPLQKETLDKFCNIVDKKIKALPPAN